MKPCVLLSLLLSLLLLFSQCAPAPEEAAQAVFFGLNKEVQAELLAAAIAFLTTPQTPYTVRLAVGGVLLNRLEHPGYGDSIFEVAYPNGGALPDTVMRADDGALEAANDLLLGLNPLPNAIRFGEGTPPDDAVGVVEIGGYWFAQE